MFVEGCLKNVTKHIILQGGAAILSIFFLLKSAISCGILTSIGNILVGKGLRNKREVVN